MVYANLIVNVLFLSFVFFFLFIELLKLGHCNYRVAVIPKVGYFSFYLLKISGDAWKQRAMRRIKCQQYTSNIRTQKYPKLGPYCIDNQYCLLIDRLLFFILFFIITYNFIDYSKYKQCIFCTSIAVPKCFEYIVHIAKMGQLKIGLENDFDPATCRLRLEESRSKKKKIKIK